MYFLMLPRVCVLARITVSRWVEITTTGIIQYEPPLMTVPEPIDGAYAFRLTENRRPRVI
jgi:hypothetical protein